MEKEAVDKRDASQHQQLRNEKNGLVQTCRGKCHHHYMKLPKTFVAHFQMAR